MSLTKVNVCSEKDCGLPIRSRGRCNRHYEAHRRRMMAYGRWESVRVPAAPVRAHYEALLAAGMSRNQVSRISGVKPDQLDNLLRPRKDRGDQLARIVFRRTADRVLAVPVPAPHEVWRYAAAGQPVHPAGTARRLQGLVALGWTNRELSNRLGVHEANFGNALYGTRQPTAGFARKVAALFNELQLTPGPSVRARLRAQRNGWASPLAWDEDTIDDPAATPDTHPDAEEVTVDPVTVDRGAQWVLTRPTSDRTDPRWQAWRESRPAMNRLERIAVAERLAGQVALGSLYTTLGLRRSDVEHLAVAS